MAVGFMQQGSGGNGSIGGGAAQGAGQGASFGPWGAVIGAALGAIQGNQEADRAKKAQKYNAEVIRRSPWLGMGNMQEAPQGSMLGGAAQGGFQGYQQGQNIQQAQQQDDINEAKLKYYNRLNQGG